MYRQKFHLVFWMIADEMIHIKIGNLMMAYDNDGYGRKVSMQLGGILGMVGTCTCKDCKNLAQEWKAGLRKLNFFSIFMSADAKILIILSLISFVAIAIVLSRLTRFVTIQLNLFCSLLILISTYFVELIIIQQLILYTMYKLLLYFDVFYMSLIVFYQSFVRVPIESLINYCQIQLHLKIQIQRHYQDSFAHTSQDLKNHDFICCFDVNQHEYNDCQRDHFSFIQFLFYQIQQLVLQIFNLIQQPIYYIIKLNLFNILIKNILYRELEKLLKKVIKQITSQKEIELYFQYRSQFFIKMMKSDLNFGRTTTQTLGNDNKYQKAHEFELKNHTQQILSKKSIMLRPYNKSFKLKSQRKKSATFRSNSSQQKFQNLTDRTNQPYKWKQSKNVRDLKNNQIQQVLGGLIQKARAFHRFGFKSYQKADTNKIFSEMLNLPKDKMNGTLYIGQLWNNKMSANYLKLNKITMNKTKFLQKLKVLKSYRTKRQKIVFKEMESVEELQNLFNQKSRNNIDSIKHLQEGENIQPYQEVNKTYGSKKLCQESMIKISQQQKNKFRSTMSLIRKNINNQFTKSNENQHRKNFKILQKEAQGMHDIWDQYFTKMLQIN